MTFQLTIYWIHDNGKTPTVYVWPSEPANTNQHGFLLVRHPGLGEVNLGVNNLTILRTEFVVFP